MEKRGSERVATRVMAEFFPSAGPDSALENKATGMTCDLSSEGLFVQTARLPPDGQTLCLLLHLPGQEPVVLTGEIVRTVGVVEARAADLPAGFAVRLLYRPRDFSAYLSALNLRERPA
jgi:hypothetical protein